MKHRADLFEPGCHPFEGGYMCGLGGIIIRSHWKCPAGCSENARLVVHYPNSGFYPPRWSCECGDTFSDEGREQRPFARYWRRDAQRRFELDWDKALPEGTTYVYDVDFLVAVVLPDGTRVDRFKSETPKEKEEESVDHPLPGE